MKKIFTTFIFCFAITICFSQAGEWVWINGDTAINSIPEYGNQGIPDSLNHPAAAYEGCEWTDKQGNFWYFGGITSLGYENDLWKFDPIINEWAWMNGPALFDDPGYYGTQGVPSAINVPPSRGFGIATWVDTSGNLWLYGGADFNNGVRNDVWMYNISINQWTWIKGDNSPNSSPVYGIQGIPSVFNTPGSRSEVVLTWVDSSNNLWLYGGASITLDSYGDLWKYNISTSEWTWMKGTNNLNSSAIYGIQGQSDVLNTPGGRYGYSKWKDANNNFWLFGGLKSYANHQYLNDLWKYNISINEWTWIKGPNLFNNAGTHGLKCEPAINNNPSNRMENRSCWTDNYGNFYMFGGGTYGSGNPFLYLLNDLWTYTISTNKWTWVWGDSLTNQPGNNGSLSISSPLNKPTCRIGASSWFDSNTNSMFLFGGWDVYPPNNSGSSVLWKYTIDPNCPTPTGIFENTPLNQLLIIPNPASTEFQISNFKFQSGDEIILTDVLGKIIFRKKILSPTSDFRLLISGFSNGIYFLQLKTKEEVLSRKVVVQR